SGQKHCCCQWMIAGQVWLNAELKRARKKSNAIVTFPGNYSNTFWEKVTIANYFLKVACPTLVTTSHNFFEAMQHLKSELCSHVDLKMDGLQTSINSLQSSLTTLDDHMTLIEQRFSGNEDMISDLEKRVKELEKQNNYLTDKVEDLENRSRSSNLQFLNVPERAEGRDMLGFIQQLIPQLLGKMNFSSPPVIERAHRTGTTHREGIRKGDLSFQGSRVYIYPDFSAGVLEKRRQFDPVKKKLRELDIKYSLQYPALLRVIYDGTSTLYRTPTEVETFLSKVGDATMIFICIFHSFLSLFLFSYISCVCKVSSL
uniref:L1 transposable element RRM domain-containing protein n=1 Tax=Sparus aurata TaxID=8175 RepID=A0A671UH91_SPAAU